MKLKRFFCNLIRKMFPAGLFSFTALFSFLPFIKLSPDLKDLDPSKVSPTVKNTFFENNENKHPGLFGKHNVMVIVPHQDDEVNLTGGILDSYIDAGSTVRIVFVTNGDYTGNEKGILRYHEAIESLKLCGIEENNIIFLGYGDQWKDKHIYNALPDEIVTSNAGNTATYGTEDHPAYREHTEYTRNNLKTDMRTVIEEYLPDTIFCVDMDGHKDHRAVSLFFDEVMGEILKDNDLYSPKVYKGFAYETSWYAEKDFYAQNLLSTVNPDPTPYIAENSCYEWTERVRFPISEKSLSRFSYNTLVHQMLGKHASQNALRKEAGILSGDRIFFERYTDSVLYRSVIQTSTNSDISGRINDFKLLDSKNVSERYCMISDNVWFPALYDMQKEIRIILPEPKNIRQVWLYDNPDETSNILDCTVTLSNGLSQHSGKLNPNGSASIIRFDTNDTVESITIRLISTEGDSAGFCEIEAYESDPKIRDCTLLKLTDKNGNFVYDYWMDNCDETDFSFYMYPSPVTGLNLNISDRSSYACQAELQNDRIHITCPKGCKMYVSVHSKGDASLYDAVKISNPSTARRVLISEMQRKEYFRYAG